MDGVAAEHIWKAYGGRMVLRDVSFHIPAGGRVALSGPSGAGKTTLLRLFLRLETPDRGIIRGPDRWAAAFQEDRLLDHLDALTNLRLVLGRDYDGDRAVDLLDALGLGDALEPVETENGHKFPSFGNRFGGRMRNPFGDGMGNPFGDGMGNPFGRNGGIRPGSRTRMGKRVRDYSGGMRRRLALARALLSPAEAVALDEPFTGLDDVSRRRCVDAIARLGAGRTILLASHDPRDAADLGAETLELSELNGAEASAGEIENDQGIT